MKNNTIEMSAADYSKLTAATLFLSELIAELRGEIAAADDREDVSAATRLRHQKIQAEFHYSTLCEINSKPDLQRAAAPRVYTGQNR